MTDTVYTRADYMSEPYEVRSTGKPHRRYYAQFVNRNTINQVVARIGSKRLLASTNPHLNDIPLKEWDNLSGSLILARTFKSTGDSCTLGGLVCAAKEAARQYIESTHAAQTK